MPAEIWKAHADLVGTLMNGPFPYFDPMWN